MTAPSNQVSQVKLAIKQIVDNLQQLEKHQDPDKDLLTLKTDTEQLLKHLESLPLEDIRNKLNKRQRKRHNKKLQKLKNKEISKVINKQNGSKLYEDNTTSKASRDNKPKSHYQNKIVKECQRFLQTFELLEQLHLLRGQNTTETYKFSLKLRQLKSIWNCLLQDKLQEQTSAELKIKQQWDEVLFGPPEKTYFQEKPDLQDFIRKRQIWDSYIDSKNGSSIPIGWILPPAKTEGKWLQYLAPANV
ncbi:programmed cell death protein 7-like [Lucilia sericata]|uniref:programmed cell death protein 7 n=1 Tax=Lucilia sericata TaxID=13632 RepID=UPI0018A81D1A|nr:programmed cell death protein 7 [Lucilia sericata]XP_037826836.1 programmed cell death protein 7-like [Lucilia sericata]